VSPLYSVNDVLGRRVVVERIARCPHGRVRGGDVRSSHSRVRECE
jgi:hypothetical protein